MGNIYSQADLDLFRAIQPELETGTLGEDTAIYFMTLGWIQRKGFAANIWELTEAGARQLKDPRDFGKLQDSSG